MLTNQQQAIVKAVAEGSGNVLVVARAGSGKTYTLVEAAHAYRQAHPNNTVQVLAFNTKIKQELEQRMPPGVAVKTLNGLGHGAIARYLGRSIPLVVSQNKTSLLLRKMSAGMNIDKEEWSNICTLVGAAKTHCLLPSDHHRSGRGLMPDTPVAWAELQDNYGCAISPDLLPLVKQILNASIDEAFRGQLDFNDQCYLPVVFNLSFFQADLVLIDEAQDLNEAQHWMVKASRSYRGRIVAVGDPQQAIYGFRGAVTDSMKRLAETFNMEQLELSVSFRCSKAVIRHAQRLVPSIEALPDAEEGEVVRPAPWRMDQFRHLPQPTAVLCRNAAPLVVLAYGLLAKRIPFNFTGRDIGKGLLALATKLVGSAKGQFDNDKLMRDIEIWAAREADFARATDCEHRIDSIYDKADSLRGILAATGASAFDQLEEALDQIFAATGGVTLATGHASKGLEWHTVYFLDRYLLPSKYAQERGEDSPQMQQENNLKYVMRTRAKSRLVYINSSDAEDMTAPTSCREDSQERNELFKQGAN